MVPPFKEIFWKAFTSLLFTFHWLECSRKDHAYIKKLGNLVFILGDTFGEVIIVEE